jgi:hypothetical protein
MHIAQDRKSGPGRVGRAPPIVVRPTSVINFPERPPRFREPPVATTGLRDTASDSFLHPDNGFGGRVADMAVRSAGADRSLIVDPSARRYNRAVRYHRPGHRLQMSREVQEEAVVAR